MFVESLRSVGFRNLSGTIAINHPLGLVVGENNVGKSNLIDALRLVLEPDSGPRSRLYLSIDDFTRGPDGKPASTVLQLSVVIAGLGEDDKARMVTCLAPTLGPAKATITLRGQLTPAGRINSDWLGGDKSNPDIERWAREAVRYTYLPPLRDAASDLRPGRDNRLVSLIKAIAGPDHPDREEVEKIVGDANTLLAAVDTIVSAKTRVQSGLEKMVGGSAYQHTSDLVFAEPRFDKIIAGLRALAGVGAPGELSENGLGFNNLLYMSVLLSALAEPSDAAVRILLVEEPEAHLHPQLQDLLLSYLKEQTSDAQATQVLATSHSPNFASNADLESLTVMMQSAHEGASVGRAIKDFGIEKKHLAHLRRFLDVTKASLLFAKGVILVEGVAEQLLLPHLATRCSQSLAKNGIALINVGGVAFQPFMSLFDETKLPYRCLVISDSDPADNPTDEETADSDESMSAVAKKLISTQTSHITIKLATQTLEWDLAHAGNWQIMVEALAPIKPRVSNRLNKDLENASEEERAAQILAAVKNVKGRFAQELAALLEDPERAFSVPEYISSGLKWVCPTATAKA